MKSKISRQQLIQHQSTKPTAADEIEVRNAVNKARRKPPSHNNISREDYELALTITCRVCKSPPKEGCHMPYTGFAAHLVPKGTRVFIGPHVVRLNDAKRLRARKGKT